MLFAYWFPALLAKLFMMPLTMLADQLNKVESQSLRICKYKATRGFKIIPPRDYMAAASRKAYSYRGRLGPIHLLLPSSGSNEEQETAGSDARPPMVLGPQQDVLPRPRP
ncbi:hypothetical protein F4806DRAFT_70398 [Annulohypoxylon nitens]|nr:hypothetical protein F4806DRAFT_70398 [Annulohypoxylon nitens]